MKRIKKVLSFILVTVLSLGVFALVGCKKTDEPIEELSVNNLVITPNVTNGIELVTLNSEVVQTDAGAYLSQTLQATVLPANAPDKSVTWSVAWNYDNSENVSNYVTVVPQSEGSTLATVRCYKGFEGDIIITVKTNVGGFTASCLVSFIGKPSALLINQNGSNVANKLLELLTGVDYSFDLEMINPINDVGENYGQYEVSTSMRGVIEIDAYCCENGITSTTEKTTVQIDLSKGQYLYFDCPNHGTINSNNAHQWKPYLRYFDDYVDVSLNDNTLNIRSNKIIEGFETTLYRTGYYFKFSKVVEPIYFDITVRDTVSGISQSFTTHFTANTSSVSLNSSSVVF